MQLYDVFREAENKLVCVEAKKQRGGGKFLVTKSSDEVVLWTVINKSKQHFNIAWATKKKPQQLSFNPNSNINL